MVVPLRSFCVVLALALAGGWFPVSVAAQPKREPVLFEVEHEPAHPGLDVYVLGDLPELGANDLTQAVRLLSPDRRTWRIVVSLPVNRTYTYRFYERLSFAPGDPSNGVSIGGPVTTSTTRVDVVPARKTMLYHSSFTAPILHWRHGQEEYESMPLRDYGPGRGPGERRWVAPGFGAARQRVEFFLSDDAGAGRDPTGDETYDTPLDAFLVQDGHLYTYVPAATVTPQRRDYDVLADGFSSTRIQSSILGETREYRVMLPRGYEANRYRRYPVTYLHESTGLWDAAIAEPFDPDGAQAAELTRLGELGEVILVGSDNLEPTDCGWQEKRIRDYVPPGDGAPDGFFQGMCSATDGAADRYAMFLIDELKPFIDRRYRTKPERKHTAATGWSASGTLAMYLGWDFGEVFGRVGAQSYYRAPHFQSRLSFESKRDVRFYVDAGMSESLNLAWAFDLRNVLVSRVAEPYVLGDDLGYHEEVGAVHTWQGAGSRFPRLLPFLNPATGEATECYDGIDNDDDGRVDWGYEADAGDPGCATALDPSEDENPCSDGIDNDADGRIDFDDPGCASGVGRPEDPPCDDGIDNDEDGLTDFDDPNCSAIWPYWESSPCGLGVELALVVPALLWMHRRARRRPSTARH